MAEQRTYEIVFIVNPTVDEESLNALSENLQQILTTQGATIVKAESMGRRRFAYPIGRLTEGTYMLFEVEGTGKEIAELERRMRVNDQIVRYITVRVDEDRQRAEKFRARRAKLAEKIGSGAAARQRAATAAAGGGGSDDADDDDDTDLDDNDSRGGGGGNNNRRQPQNGRRYRRRKVSRLLIDKVDIIDFKDVDLLVQYIPERAKIVPRRISGTTAVHQRMLAEAIKRARNIALLPFATD